MMRSLSFEPACVMIPFTPSSITWAAPESTRVTTGTHPRAMASSIDTLSPSYRDESTKMSCSSSNDATRSGATGGSRRIRPPRVAIIASISSAAGPSPSMVSLCATPRA